MRIGKQHAIILGAVLAVAFVELIRTAWISDDAAITLRSVLNLLHGYGATYNVDERVQAYTHPLWFGLIAAASLVTRNVFVSTFMLSIGISLAVLWMLVVRVGTRFWAGMLGVAALIFSKAYVDFSTSGLENPLSHLLVLLATLAAVRAIERHDQKAVTAFFISCSLLYLARPDLLLLMLPTSLLVMIRYVHQPGMLIRCVVVGAIPVVAWTAWSLYYYGFPFPNTAYAKLGAGVPLSERSVQGGVYLLDSIKRDPLTLAFIGVGVAAGLTSSSILDRVLAAGCLLYLAFVMSIGGDFMTGRFLTAPLLVAAVVIARSVLSTRHLWALAVGVGVLAVVGINATLLSGSRYSDTVIDEDTGIADERGFYFQSYGLMPLADSDRLQQRDWTLSGSTRTVTIVCGGLGFKGIELGPAAHLIDECGLGDPLLARLPAERTGKWRIGHFERQLPTDYRESVERQANLLRDPRTRAYYESIRTITRGNLNSLDRLREIARMNLGLVDTPDWRMYRETKIPASVAPANHVLTKLRLDVEGASEHASGLHADAEGRRLYITRPRRVTVFDLDTLQQVAEMDGVGGDGVAVDPRTHHGFISGSPVVMFDTRTMRPITSIDVDRLMPRGILFDSFTRRVYVLGERATSVAIVDSENGTLVGSVELGGVPRSAEADGRGTLYVLMSDSSTIAAVDLGARKVTRRYPVGDYSACNGLALDDTNGVLFVTCARSPSRLPMTVILGASDGRMISTVPLSSTPNGGVVFSPVTMEAFSTHENGTMTVVREETPNDFRVEDTVETINRTRTITLDRKTGHVFTMSEDPASGSLTVLVIGK